MKWLISAAVAAVLLLVTGAAAVAFSPEREPRAAYRDGTGTAPRTSAGLDLGGGADSITVRTADLGTDLFRAGDGTRVSDDGGRITLTAAAPSVQVLLSDTITWDLRVLGGAKLTTVDLGGARLSAVDLSGGADRINLTLPQPDGTLLVRMTGGVNRFDVHTAGEAPVRVRVGAGAGQVVLDGTRHDGVAAGSEFTGSGWARSVDRIDVDAVAGMSALTVGP